ncbi:SRPBCC family protein [Azovibrio restrictus]|uniref:SRPBCC family protein n=1 Tax=Azovibrio restrictus TaxID=146938 RepID=UPI0026EACC53|nr:SRPBCC family protein [Azovibrio restrictus]
MHFEHLVQINDPANPLLQFLSREQLWRGLWQRVENPMIFLPGLESCQILERAGSGWLRQLDFGAARIRDRVTFVEPEWLRFDIEAGAGHPGGSLVIHLEEPEPGALFLRFVYQTTLNLEGAERQYMEYVKSAYRESDLETVRVIRLLLAEGTCQ